MYVNKSSPGISTLSLLYWSIIPRYLRTRPNESRDEDFPSTKCQRPSRRTDERVDARGIYFPWDGELSLKVDEPPVDRRDEDVERKQGYYHIIIFFERT